MEGIGITAEYNPFHSGHEYLLGEARGNAGDCAVIAVMSGDYVQRGEPALFDKFTRAEAACACGADIVVELPLPWCIAGAENFASGALSILNGMCIGEVCFGVEKNDPEMIRKAAETLVSDQFDESVRQLMNENKKLPYAAARETVLSGKSGIDGALLREPNTILGTEYVKAILNGGYDISVHTVQRLGSRHDSSDGESILCAAEIRRLTEKGENISRLVPKCAAPVYESALSEGRRIDRKSFSRSVLSGLSVRRGDDFSAFEFCSRELSDAINEGLMHCGSIAAMEDFLCNKNITRAKARRALLSAALEIPKGETAGSPAYARLLACSGKGRDYLKEKKKDFAVPVLTKPADVKALSQKAAAQFALGARAHDFYMLNTAGGTYVPAEDWKTGPAIL